jgi:hypothetical protein
MENRDKALHDFDVRDKDGSDETTGNRKE